MFWLGGVCCCLNEDFYLKQISKSRPKERLPLTHRFLLLAKTQRQQPKPRHQHMSYSWDLKSLSYPWKHPCPALLCLVLYLLWMARSISSWSWGYSCFVPLTDADLAWISVIKEAILGDNWLVLRSLRLRLRTERLPVIETSILKLGMMAHDWNPNTSEAEIGGFWVCGQPGL